VSPARRAVGRPDGGGAHAAVWQPEGTDPGGHAARDGHTAQTCPAGQGKGSSPQFNRESGHRDI